MSQENVDSVRRSFDAFARGGIEGLMPYLAPEIEWTTTGEFLEAATYHGHAEVRRYLGTLLAEFDEIQIEPTEFIDAGEQVVVSIRLSGRGKLSGAPVELTMTQVSSSRDGLAVSIRNYPTRAEALEAAGLED